MCTHCGDCVKQCPTQALAMVEGKVHWNKDLCCNCDTCIHVCKHMASPKIQWMEVEQLVQEVLSFRSFIRGVTVSGGECMNYADFLLDFFREVKRQGLGALIDSNGYYDFKNYPELLSLSDGVMLDVKAVDPILHKRLCGQENSTVLANLDFLLEQGKLEEVRTVLLPQQEKQNKKTIAYVAEHIKNRCRYKLIAYRPFGVREEGITAIGNQMLSTEEMKEYEKFAKECGCLTITIV